MEIWGISPLIKAFRRNSLTFSLLFATVILGASAAVMLRSALHSVGVAWPLAWLGTLLIIGFLAKREDRIRMRPEFKKLVSRILIYGALLLSVLLTTYQCEMKKRTPEFPEEEPAIKRTGPRGKH